MLSPGFRVGSYEIVAPLGAGGMGEVYRARDVKLNREVAVKVLPERLRVDEASLARFEREAQAVAALSHPNILSIHDFGATSDLAYAVTELLEGETLRARLDHGALPQRKAIEYALQISHGLAAAHQKGIVHRDLKPENIFITQDGRVKILDFGLAKIAGPQGEASSLQTQSGLGTSPGTVMGTVGYMSPEQVRGQVVDHRTDVFSFGVVLYEMLTGRRAFHGDSQVETMNAILKEDPPEISVSGGAVMPALDRIARRCLEKSPAERFHSAHDLGLALETLSGASHSSGATLTAAAAPSSRRLIPWVLCGAAIAVAAAAYFAGRHAGAPEAGVPVDYARLTYRYGRINSARLAGDGKTVVYSAEWGSEPNRLFSTQAGSPDSLTLAYPNADIASVSSSGELALILNRRILVGYARVGTLARASLTGGAARAVLEDVQDADWLPDGSGFAAIRYVDKRYRLEFPAGKPVYDTAGYISDVRVSPDGALAAFVDHPILGDDRGSIAVIDRNGKRTGIPGDYSSAQGIAWAASGKEIWFTAADRGNACGLFAATVGGTPRVVLRVPGSVHLGDIGRDGKVLLWQAGARSGIVGRLAGDATDRDLSWFDWSTVPRLSSDGKTLLLTEEGDGGGADYSVFVRGTDGGPAVRLGSGLGVALSPDGKWVLTVRLNPNPGQYVLLPTGAGESKVLTHDDLAHGLGWFSADGTHIVFSASAPGRPPRMYRQDLVGGTAEPRTPENVTGPPSPDGTLVPFEGKLYPTGGGEPRPIPGLEPADQVEAWSGDSKSLFVRQLPDAGGAKIFRLDIATGRRALLHDIRVTPGTRSGVWLTITPDGASYFYSYLTSQADLFLVTGLR